MMNAYDLLAYTDVWSMHFDEFCMVIFNIKNNYGHNECVLLEKEDIFDSDDVYV
jgi:hypothetical protein